MPTIQGLADLAVIYNDKVDIIYLAEDAENAVNGGDANVNEIHLAAHDLAKLDLWYAAGVRRVKSPADMAMLVTMMMTSIKMVMEAMLMIKMMTMEMKSHSKTANKVVSSGSARRWQETSRRYSLKDNEACLWWSWTG